MLPTPSNPKLAFALTLIWGLVSFCEGRLLGQSASDNNPAGDITAKDASPAPHSPPILTPTQKPAGMWNQLSGQQFANGEQLPNKSSARVNLRILPVQGVPLGLTPVQSSSANAVTLPVSDETEKAIAEVRLRLGSVGNRFSDLLSPEDEARLFAEALNQVRQEQQPSATPQLTQTPPLPQLPSATPDQVPLDRPRPGLIPPPAMLPPLAVRPPAATYPAPPGTQSQSHWAPVQPTPPLPTIPSDQLTRWNQPGHQPGHQPAQQLPFPPSFPQPETERAALRRIAREVDALAEQLENIKHYSEADSLRRSAQQFRESVR
ncbi:MAG: hypothetical protein ACKO0N_01975 [Planctomycetota bacterium]